MKRRTLLLVLLTLAPAPVAAITLEELGLDEPIVTGWIQESMMSGIPVYGASTPMLALPPGGAGRGGPADG